MTGIQKQAEGLYNSASEKVHDFYQSNKMWLDATYSATAQKVNDYFTENTDKILFTLASVAVVLSCPVTTLLGMGATFLVNKKMIAENKDVNTRWYINASLMAGGAIAMLLTSGLLCAYAGTIGMYLGAKGAEYLSQKYIEIQE